MHALTGPLMWDVDNEALLTVQDRGLSAADVPARRVAYAQFGPGAGPSDGGRGRPALGRISVGCINQSVLLSVIVRQDRIDVEEQLATEVSTLLRRILPLKAAAARELPAGGHDRTAMLLLFPLVQGPQRAAALAEECHADPSTISRQVAELVRRGLVERQADPSDGRASLLAITDAGREVCDRVRMLRRQLFATAVDGWTDDELATLAHLLGRFNDALGDAFCPPEPRLVPTAHPARDQDIS